MKAPKHTAKPRPVIPTELERIIQRIDAALDLSPGIAAVILGDFINDLRQGEYGLITEGYDFPQDFDAAAAIRQVLEAEGGQTRTGNPRDILNTAAVATILGLPQAKARRWIACHSRRLQAWRTGGDGGGAWRVQRAALDRARRQLGLAAVQRSR